MVLPYIEGNQASAEAILEPFRTMASPVFAQTETAATHNAVSHGGDDFLLNAPPRVVIACALFSELYDDVMERLWTEWVEFTETQEARDSLILFEFWKKGKVDGIKVADTAFPVRTPHWYMAMGAR